MIKAVLSRARISLLLIGAAVVIVALIALLGGASSERAAAIGFYAVGGFLAIIGFALGSRNLFRPRERKALQKTGGTADLWETIEAAAVLIVLGLALLVVGVAVDPHARLI